jgi:hypothetical protein
METRIDFSASGRGHGVYSTCEACMTRVLGKLMTDPEWYARRLRENGDYEGYSLAHFVAAECEALHGDGDHTGWRFEETVAATMLEGELALMDVNEVQLMSQDASLPEGVRALYSAELARRHMARHH